MIITVLKVLTNVSIKHDH